MLGYFLPVFTRETTLLNSVCVPVHKALSENGSTLKGKNWLPKGANFFL